MTVPNLICPQCRGILHETTVHGVRLDVCRDRCRGLWFDSGELETWAQHAGEHSAREVARADVAAPAAGAEVCPRCTASTLVSRSRGGLSFLRCSACDGNWVPAATLTALAPPEPSWLDGLGFALPDALVHIVAGILLP